MSTPAHVIASTTDAWTSFWADSTQSRCAAGAPEIQQAIADHWTSFAHSLPQAAHVLDLGCGVGAVGRLLLAARDDLRVTGVDSAQVPASKHPRLDLRSDTRMEALPFPGRTFGAVVSQFGFEYGQTNLAAAEIARVVIPGAKLSLLVHHAESAIVCATRARLSAVVAFLGPTVRNAFCGGDAAGFEAQMSLLVQRYPDDPLIDQLARALPSRLDWMRDRRISTWRALEDALAPESRVSESLNACCVAASRIGEWLGPLRRVCELAPVSVLREPGGDPIAWRTEGVRAA